MCACIYIYIYIVFCSCSSLCFVAFVHALGVILVNVVKMGSIYCM